MQNVSHTCMMGPYRLFMDTVPHSSPSRSGSGAPHFCGHLPSQSSSSGQDGGLRVDMRCPYSLRKVRRKPRMNRVKQEHGDLSCL